MAKKDSTATIDKPEETIEMKEFEEMAVILAPYVIDGETPSQTLERLLEDRNQLVFQVKNGTKNIAEDKISFVKALTGISDKKAEAIFSNFTGTHKQYEEQLANKTITWQTPIAIVAHTLDLLMKEPG